MNRQELMVDQCRGWKRKDDRMTPPLQAAVLTGTARTVSGKTVDLADS